MQTVWLVQAMLACRFIAYYFQTKELAVAKQGQALYEPMSRLVVIKGKRLTGCCPNQAVSLLHRGFRGEI
jgi:hypothetical protein